MCHTRLLYKPAVVTRLSEIAHRQIIFTDGKGKETSPAEAFAMKRRQFNTIIGITIATPLTAVTLNQTALSADLVDPQSSTARSLQFMTASDKEGIMCAGCNFYSAAESDSGSCIIFNGGVVPASGWCSAFQPKK